MLNSLQRRVLEISYRRGLSHIGSNISILSLLERVYRLRHPDEPVVLGEGHCGLGLYACLEAFHGLDAEKLLDKHGIHATRDEENGIYVSSGSLGQAEAVALGLALAKPERRVWLVSSDGGMAEGVCWEILRYYNENRVSNLRWLINANGFGATRAIDVYDIERRIMNGLDPEGPAPDVCFTGFAGIPFLSGVGAHYYKMSAADWAWVEANS